MASKAVEERIRHEAEVYCEVSVPGWEGMARYMRDTAVEALVQHVLAAIHVSGRAPSDEEITALIAGQPFDVEAIPPERVRFEYGPEGATDAEVVEG